MQKLRFPNHPKTELHIATQQRDISKIKFLIDNGADQTILSPDQKIPLQIALENQDTESFKILLKGLKPGDMDYLSIRNFFEEKFKIIARNPGGNINFLKALFREINQETKLDLINLLINAISPYANSTKTSVKRTIWYTNKEFLKYNTLKYMPAIEEENFAEDLPSKSPTNAQLKKVESPKESPRGK